MVCMGESASDAGMEKQSLMGYPGSSGGAERTAWEALVDMVKCSNNVEELDQGAGTLVVDSATTFDKVQLNMVWAWAMHVGFYAEFFEYFVGTA